MTACSSEALHCTALHCRHRSTWHSTCSLLVSSSTHWYSPTLHLPLSPLCLQLSTEGAANLEHMLRVFIVIISVGFSIAEAIDIAPDFAMGGGIKEKIVKR